MVYVFRPIKCSSFPAGIVSPLSIWIILTSLYSVWTAACIEKGSLKFIKENDLIQNDKRQSLTIQAEPMEIEKIVNNLEKEIPIKQK